MSLQTVWGEQCLYTTKFIGNSDGITLEMPTNSSMVITVDKSHQVGSDRFTVGFVPTITTFERRVEGWGNSFFVNWQTTYPGTDTRFTVCTL